MCRRDTFRVFALIVTLGSIVAYVPTVCALQDGTVVAVRGIVERANFREYRDFKTGALREKKLFLVVRPSEDRSKLSSPLVVDASATTLVELGHIPAGTVLNMQGLVRTFSSAEVSELERRIHGTSSSDEDRQLLSTIYNVISVMWKEGTAGAGTRPGTVTWLEAQSVR